MSAKSKKTPASSSQSSSTASQSRSSPLSPTRLTRLQEKVELQNLNDRLANYIDRVRHLESENNRLNIQIQTTQETVTREVTSVKGSYEKELSDTRQLLDETAKEKARLQLDAGRARAELGELTPKYNKTKNDLLQAEKKVQQLESRNNELSTSLYQLKNDLARAIEEKKEIAAEMDKLAKQVPELQQQLETELLARTDLENRNMTLKEELSFKQQMYEREMTEVRSNKQVEISEIDGRLQEHYQARLQTTLQELRDQYESQIQQSRDEVEALYQNKVQDLEEQMKKQRSAASSHYEEVIQTRARLNDCNLKLSELESANAHLKSRIAELERNMESERAAHAKAINEASVVYSAMGQGEINRLREQMAVQLQEYQDLMDIRTALDMEISAYRKLLEGEETRLNLTPTVAATTSQSTRAGTPSRRTPTRALKRKRTMLEESSSYSLADYVTSASAKGDVEVSEVDAEGKFIRLQNKGDKEVSLSGWQLVHKAQETETIYKFHRSLKVAPGGSVTVWSAGSGAAHEPPSTLVMKEQRWFVASEMVTQLLNNNGEEMAQRESKRAQTSTSIHRQREEYRGLGGPEELHHQQGDPEGKDRCIVM
ncbi:lamin-like protein [Daphnia sinensis]|uniref:Lamin-like protein n=1 Tax=Daphnia sinensis TaxID=1820382 RepID=A0AAD5PPG3_9CRUS|nr:lamin-like protein [Daphnia sinensis]